MQDLRFSRWWRFMSWCFWLAAWSYDTLVSHPPTTWRHNTQYHDLKLKIFMSIFQQWRIRRKEKVHRRKISLLRYTISVGKLQGKRQFARSWSRWENNIKMYLRERWCVVKQWTELPQDTVQYISFPRRTLVHALIKMLTENQCLSEEATILELKRFVI